MNLKLPYFALLFILNVLHAQKDPVRWVAKYTPQRDGRGIIEITGLLDKGWHTYSTKTKADGPIPTSFTFQPAPFYQTVGDIQEIGVHEEYVAAFDAKLALFSEKATFLQYVNVPGPKGGKVKITVEYMCCNDNMCLPPKTIDLWVEIK
ncbi:MAG: protein-disulfide reductase DsbD family protein [Bacteroidia bacterium]|nr:protein-disulfide reductase DsbD family protein [Bacteroidia bacterium]